MAKSTYPCANCDKPVTIEGRNRADADRRAKWCADKGKICYDCEQKQRAENQAAQNAAAAERAAAEQLPILTGTEKQNAYAETVRRAFIDQWDATTSRGLQDTFRELHDRHKIRPFKRSDLETAKTELLDALALLRAEAMERTDSKFWLDSFATILRNDLALGEWQHATLQSRPALTPVLTSLFEREA